MCTLTYYPGKGGSIITANRDESPHRNSKSLSEFNTDSNEYLIAKEPRFGGTNIAIGRLNRTVVLLNGAFKPHKMGAYSGMSRGLVLLELLKYDSLIHFTKAFSLEDVEPFTLVEFRDFPVELRWDGTRSFIREYPQKKPAIWASAQLYSKPVIEARERWFNGFLSRFKENISPEDLWNFHHSAGEGDSENDLVMNRLNLVRTVSVTQVSSILNKKIVKHHNLVDDQLHAHEF
jgi:hypothetical protein